MKSPKKTNISPTLDNSTSIVDINELKKQDYNDRMMTNILIKINNIKLIVVPININNYVSLNEFISLINDIVCFINDNNLKILIEIDDIDKMKRLRIISSIDQSILLFTQYFQKCYVKSGNDLYKKIIEQNISLILYHTIIISSNPETNYDIDKLLTWNTSLEILYNRIVSNK